MHEPLFVAPGPLGHGPPPSGLLRAHFTTRVARLCPVVQDHCKNITEDFSLMTPAQREWVLNVRFMQLWDASSAIQVRMCGCAGVGMLRQVCIRVCVLWGVGGGRVNE